MTKLILCDYCKTDLSTSSNSIDWRISLHSEKIPSRGGAVTDMYIHAPLEKDYHFCGLGCLKKSLDNGIIKPSLFMTLPEIPND